MTSLEDRHCTPMQGAEQASNLFQGTRRFWGKEETGRNDGIQAQLMWVPAPWKAPPSLAGD